MTGLLTSIGGAVGQFLMQGALGVGETYSLAALGGTVSSIGVGDVIGTFVLSGTFGMIGAKQAAAGFGRIGQIESSFIKYATRDISRYICQKDLITEGSIEEFENIFEGLIVKKIRIKNITLKLGNL